MKTIKIVGVLYVLLHKAILKSKFFFTAFLIPTEWSFRLIYILNFHPKYMCPLKFATQTQYYILNGYEGKVLAFPIYTTDSITKYSYYSIKGYFEYQIFL